MSIRPVVEIEDEIYTYQPADNGAGPLWCHGSTIVARHGDTVYAAGLETIPEEAPLNNCRWVLFAREAEEWGQVHSDTTGRTREPSPVALVGDDLLVTTNPTLAESGTYSGPADPAVFRFSTTGIDRDPTIEKPAWKGQPEFSEHSYRTVTTDGTVGEVLYMQNVGYNDSYMSLLDRAGNWQGLGTLTWPYGGEYPEPQPLRLCYPNVILSGRAAHFFGVGDIVEPIEAWRQAKHEITGRDWDFVFRRLFYAFTPDITQQPFCDWIEIANRDATAGAMRNNDIWLAPDGTAHLIWTETTVDARIRDRFFPGEPIVQSLEYITIRDGSVLTRTTLARCTEDDKADRPALARFHATGSGGLIVLAQFSSEAPSAPGPSYRLAQVLPDGKVSEWQDIPFQSPMAGTFLTNTVRGGSAPSDIIDIVGMSPRTPNTLGYARVRLA